MAFEKIEHSLGDSKQIWKILSRSHQQPLIPTKKMQLSCDEKPGKVSLKKLVHSLIE
jgi:hypothetical protein